MLYVCSAVGRKMEIGMVSFEDNTLLSHSDIATLQNLNFSA